MTSTDIGEATRSAGVLLETFREKGIKLWLEDGDLHYRARKGTLTYDDLQLITSASPQIRAYLRGAADNPHLSAQLEQGLRHAPLTFSQSAHWHLHRLAECPAMRQLASATRLHGHLVVDVLEASLAETADRHDALRSRIVVIDGTPMQLIAPRSHCKMQVVDLTSLAPMPEEEQLIRVIRELILQPVDVAVGPLFEVCLVRLGSEEHVLVLAMEHIISDARSLLILRRDLLTTYARLSGGCQDRLPPVRLQFSEYATRKARSHRSWMDRHNPYWTQRLAGCGRVMFPADDLRATGCGWEMASVAIDRGLLVQLREWCRAQRTTVPMAMFTVYVALVLRWCDVAEAVVRYQTDGRGGPELQDTIGFFAAGLNLRLALHDDDDFLDLLATVSNEYVNALEHADGSYVDAQVPRPEFSRNTMFNWIPQRTDDALPSRQIGPQLWASGTVPFGNPALHKHRSDGEPSILLYDHGDTVDGELYFPSPRFGRATMERFGVNLKVFTRALVETPRRAVRDIALE